MRKMMGKKWISLIAAVLLAICCTAAVLYQKESKAAEMSELQKHLAEEVFRFHVLANSDSDEDQALKMKVKEAVLAYMKQELPDTKSAKQTQQWAREHTEKIEEKAQEVIRSEGYTYSVDAVVKECEFPDKTYGDVTFPAGTYEALEVLIGDAKGRNWWCCLYPNLCFVDAVHAVVPEEGKEELKSVLTDDEYDLVTGKKDVKIKWFFFERD